MKKALNRLLSLALVNNASDIHLTLVETQCVIEWRINGALQSVPTSTIKVDQRLFHYLKYISHCELSNMASPQSGSFEVEVNNKKIACRIALLSTRFRQAGVLRILNQGNYIPLDKLTYDQQALEMYHQLLTLKNGLILLTGATGSGKTTTAYSLLNAFKQRKIYSIEDPIEIYYPSIMQVQVNEANGLTYANAIKQIMRHDPDIIFIGEIRDEVAAKMAIRSALTGHLVITTLHATNCVAALYRMLDLGVDPDQFFQVLTVITCQCLVSELSRNIKFSVVEYLDEAKIMNFAQTKTIEYETLANKLALLSYQKNIAY